MSRQARPRSACEGVGVAGVVLPVEDGDHAVASSRTRRGPPVKRSIFAATLARWAFREASVELSIR